MEVYKSINRVQSILCKDGIGKDRKNEAQGYKFRGIDDIYNALSPALANEGLCILPRMISRTVDERAGRNGNAIFYVTVEAEFDFVSAKDGSKHTVKNYGEAMDSGDKATNKAMSAAYKYACLQAFAIPTEGDNDADATTHQVQPKQEQYIPKAGESIQQHIALMEACENKGDLQTVYTHAVKALKEDKDAVIKLAGHKDRLKKKFEPKDDTPDPFARNEPVPA
jgi:hypothetical protein